jgi:hypothetical protein
VTGGGKRDHRNINPTGQNLRRDTMTKNEQTTMIRELNSDELDRVWRRRE